MALPTSPSVVVIENDASIYAPNVDSSIAGIVGFADKGPTNVATLITSQNNLVNAFGRPDSNMPGQGLEGALEILETTNKVYFVRAAASDAANASATASIGFCPAVQVSSASSFVNTTTVYYEVYNNSNVLDSSAFVTVASSVGTTDSLSALKLVFDESVLGDTTLFATLDTAGNTYLASRFAGSGARLVVSSTLGENYGFYPVSSDGTNITASLGNNVTASGGTAESTGANALHAVFESIYPGRGYDLSSLRDGTIVGVSVEVDSKSVQDRLTVNSGGSQKENFDVVLTPSSLNSLTYLLNTDVTKNESSLVDSQILVSGSAFSPPDNWADIIGGGVSADFVNGEGNVTTTPRFLKLLEGTYGLANGDSGYSTTEIGGSTDYTALIGTQAAKSGMYALDDDSLNISFALVPGITAQSVQNAFVTLADTSKNFVAVLSPPYGLSTVQNAVDWTNGKGDNGRTAALNSSYAAVYWPWVQVFNFYAGADEWYDPAIFAARQFAYTDNVSEPWFAPAGYRRGRLLKPSNTEVPLNQGDKDVLYENNVNPISKENQAGILVFGQKTTQRLPTALNSVNVRRLMIFIRKVLLILGRPFQFEPNDQFTWELVEDAINPFLDDLIARRGIISGAVACNSETNTPIRVDRKEMWCSITIKPTLAAETVVFEVNLTNQAATING